MERSNDSEDEMARPHLQFANKALGFSDDPTRDQEWGYLNADRSRLGEFLDFFEQQRMVRAPFLRDFIELVMFSFGEQLVSDLSTGTHFGQQFEHRMREFVKICRNYRHRDAFRTVLTAQEACDQPLKNWLEEVLLSFGADTTWYIHD